MTIFFLMKKSFITHESAKRRLARSRKLIEQQLERKRQDETDKPISLDSAHLEHAFRKHINLYGDDGLIRMAMLMKTATQGDVSDNDIKLINRLPFYITHAPPKIQSVIRALLASGPDKSPDIEAAETARKYLGRYAPLPSTYTGIMKQILGYQKGLDKIDDYRKNLNVPAIDRSPQLYESDRKIRADIANARNSIDMYKKALDFAKNLPSNDADSLWSQFNQIPYETYKEYADAYQKDKSITPTDFFQTMLEQLNQELKQHSEKFLELQKLGQMPFLEYSKQYDPSLYEIHTNVLNGMEKKHKETYKKLETKLAKNPRFRALKEYFKIASSEHPYQDENQYLENPMPYNPWTLAMEISPSRMTSGKHGAFDPRMSGYFGLYNPTKSNLGDDMDVMDWVKRYAPGKDQHGTRPKAYLYHGTRDPSFNFWDPSHFKKTEQNYGLGLYTSLYPAVARGFAARYVNKIFVPQHFKFLSNRKYYKGTKLVKDVDKYFSDLADYMKNPELKKAFGETLKDLVAYSAYASGFKHYADKNDPEKVGLEQHFRRLDRDASYGRGREIPAEGHSWDNASQSYVDTQSNDGMKTDDENADAEQIHLGILNPARIPGAILHRAIKLTFEKFGANPAYRAPNHHNFWHVRLNNRDSTAYQLYEPYVGEIDKNYIDRINPWDSFNIGHGNVAATPYRNSTYHTTVLLSSLGYHGYIHEDPETKSGRRKMSRDMGQFRVFDETKKDKENISLGQKRWLRSVVLFPSAIADLPNPRWVQLRTDDKTGAAHYHTKTSALPTTRGKKGRYERTYPYGYIPLPTGSPPLKAKPIPKVQEIMENPSL